MIMKLEYVAVGTGRVLDTVTVPDDPAGLIRYETGLARGAVEMVLRRGGRPALADWTNGYVQLRRA
jgi:hypothetical protein